MVAHPVVDNRVEVEHVSGARKRVRADQVDGLGKNWHTVEEPVEEAEPPAGNASLEAWQQYALDLGRTPDEIDGLSRNQLRDLFAEETGEETATGEEATEAASGDDDNGPEED